MLVTRPRPVAPTVGPCSKSTWSKAIQSPRVIGLCTWPTLIVLLKKTASWNKFGTFLANSTCFLKMSHDKASAECVCPAKPPSGVCVSPLAAAVSNAAALLWTLLALATSKNGISSGCSPFVAKGHIGGRFGEKPAKPKGQKLRPVHWLS